MASARTANNLSEPIRKLYPDYETSPIAESFSRHWFFTHGYEAAQNSSKSRGDKILYFLQKEGLSDGTRSFDVQLAPLDLKGTLDDTNVKCEISFSTAGISYPVATLSGDLSEGPIGTPINNDFYFGEITLNLIGTTPNYGLIATVDWVGLGLRIHEQIITLLPED